MCILIMSDGANGEQSVSMKLVYIVSHLFMVVSSWNFPSV